MVLAYGIHAETANQYKKLEELGINVVLNGEYLETSPLGKLEWVKFLAAFYNVLAETTQKFDKVEEEYLKLSSMYTNLKTKPKVMSGMPWKGVWYVPGGSSYIARMISDAGGYYIWNSIPQRESIPLNFEKVIEHANEADIWINTGQAKTLIDILSEDERLGMIRSFKERQVYNNNARANNTGGNDFWESGLIHPQIILKDLIKIFHPQLLPDYTLVYYKKLN
jgi:iron complex transport system substrate-binding protein